MKYTHTTIEWKLPKLWRDDPPDDVLDHLLLHYHFTDGEETHLGIDFFRGDEFE